MGNFAPGHDLETLRLPRRRGRPIDQVSGAQP